MSDKPEVGNPTQPLASEWAKQQFEAGRQAVAELEPIVKENKKEHLTLFTVGYILFFVSIPFPHPADFVLMGGAWLFIALSFVWQIRGAKKSSEYELGKWKMETFGFALRIASAIQLEMEVNHEQEKTQ